MRNPLVDAAADVITALHALKISRSAIITGEGDGGLEIQEPRRPKVVLTHSNARDFCRQRQEVIAND